jgi:hypothetical protein
MENLEKVFERFRQYGIKLKPVKCEFCTKETTFLGRQVNGEGLVIGENYVQTIKEWKAPRNLKEVEQFLGFVNYHRTFIKDLSRIAAPLTELTRNKPWKWGEEQQTAFEKLKSNVVSFVQNSHFPGFNLIPYCRNRSNTFSKFSMWDSKSFPITNISSKNARTISQVRPLRTNCMALAYVAGALQRPKLIRVN